METGEHPLNRKNNLLLYPPRYTRKWILCIIYPKTSRKRVRVVILTIIESTMATGLINLLTPQPKVENLPKKPTTSGKRFHNHMVTYQQTFLGVKLTAGVLITKYGVCMIQRYALTNLNLPEPQDQQRDLLNQDKTSSRKLYPPS